jgi:uncharacterized protein
VKAKVLPVPAVAKTTKKPAPRKPAKLGKPTAKRPAKAAPPKPASRISAKPTAKPAAKPTPKPAPKPAPKLAPKIAPKPTSHANKSTPTVKPSANGHSPKSNGKHADSKPTKPVANAPKSTSRPLAYESNIPPEKDLSTKNPKGVVKDNIYLMVRDPYWLKVEWSLSYQSVQRAESALGQDWFGAKPILRLFDVTSLDTTSTSEAAIRDIPLHCGCNTWYIDVAQPPKSYRVDIGYLSRRGEFKPLARSNVVTTPKANERETLDENWKNDIDDEAAERILAQSTGFESSEGPPQLRELFDEQLKKSSKDPASFGTGAILPEKLKKFGFSIDAELIISGKTDPTARVTLGNEPIKLRSDGVFTMRYALTDGRQIIPAVAESSDGMEERTIVLAIERNTKHLDPMTHDSKIGANE